LKHNSEHIEYFELKGGFAVNKNLLLIGRNDLREIGYWSSFLEMDRTIHSNIQCNRIEA